MIILSTWNDFMLTDIKALLRAPVNTHKVNGIQIANVFIMIFIKKYIDMLVVFLQV